MLVLTIWSNFYVIIGSSAGTLTGLTFVTITLLAGRREGIRREGLNAFTTPTVVHFAAVLFTAAILSVPWTALGPVALVLGLASLIGKQSWNVTSESLAALVQGPGIGPTSEE
jgi:hypothetical protein